jgi:hypothetical protein
MPMRHFRRLQPCRRTPVGQRSIRYNQEDDFPSQGLLGRQLVSGVDLDWTDEWMNLSPSVKLEPAVHWRLGLIDQVPASGLVRVQYVAKNQ